MKIGSKHLSIVQELITARHGCSATISLKESLGGWRFYIHLHIPLELYVKHMKEETIQKGILHYFGLKLKSSL
ncbi:MAG: hypothetical protein DRN53_06590 [Thermoprotei archaeon]|nr:MAG: hypothetical protein DRN53_06590 [Thermoprotei archaeon]